MSDQSKALRSKLCIEDVCQFDDGCGCLEAIDDALMPLRAAARLNAEVEQQQKCINELYDMIGEHRDKIEQLKRAEIAWHLAEAEVERLRTKVDFWKQSSDKHFQQAMQYRERLDHYEGRKNE